MRINLCLGCEILVIILPSIPLTTEYILIRQFCVEWLNILGSDDIVLRPKIMCLLFSVPNFIFLDVTMTAISRKFPSFFLFFFSK
jgi:hypothetical protein